MIDLREVWLPQIIGYAELIETEKTLRAAWIDGDRSQTSVTDFDELIVQVFDDLDADEQIKLAMAEFSDDVELVKRVADFLKGLSGVDRVVVGTAIDTEPLKIFALPEWSSLRECSGQLRSYAERNGYRASS